jgi:hypothetical protein
MEFAMVLWKPILLSGVAVFIMSALVWTVLPHHKKEYAKFSNEDALLAALRAGKPTPGLYALPHYADQAAVNSPEGKAKIEAGPTAFVTVAPAGMPSMGQMMGLSALGCVVVMSFVAYLGYHTLQTGTAYLQVFRITGTATFMAYALATIPESIWFRRPWASYFLGAFDALLYALIAGGIFGWLWPR